MTTTARPEVFSDKVSKDLEPIGIYRSALAIGVTLSGVLLLISTLFAIGDEGSDIAVLGGVGFACLAAGGMTLRHPFKTQTLRPVSTMSASICSFLAVSAISTVVYLLTGTLQRVDDALYESVAGVSTSALTIFDDPQVVSDGVLVWRSATQWLGGFGALSLAIGLLPFLGGSRELTGGPNARAVSTKALATKPVPTMKRVAAIYSTVTIGAILAFLITGMGLRDAFAHSFSTVSTGGFSTHADSLGHFDSVTVDIVAIVLMAGAASSVALAWMVWRRSFDDARRAFELQFFFGVMFVSTLWVTWLRRSDELSFPQGIRESLFAVVSAMSTTGHRISDWGTWHPGASTLLLLLLVVGGTAGSVSGGLRWIRVLGMAQFVWRELQRQLHPRSIRTVKVGRTPISESSVDRMHAQMVFVMVLGASASLVLALFGEGITEAITLTISAISTSGPGFDDTQSIVTAADLTRPERGVLMPVMLTGRVFLYPAFVASAAAVAGTGRALRSLGKTRR